jgi:uncharacterized repeat protein (TIGR03803 family)
MKLLIRRTAMLVLLAANLFAGASRAAAQHASVLFSFAGDQKTANGPLAGLIFDTSGNLYGTTLGGGNGTGTVFELTPVAGGGWTEKTLYSFGVSGSGDGNYPGAGLVFDAPGNLYGTTEEGGSGCNPPGCGAVFELTPAANGEWTEKILYSFQANGTDGTFPRSSVVIDAQGNLYGTTFFGGPNNLGTVYELEPTVSGSWKEKTLHSFGNGGDGQNPQASLILDASGNLYGTTTGDGPFLNGTYIDGTVFKLTRTASGGWKDEVLHSFGTENDGGFILNGLFVDAAGNLYGTTSNGGSQGVGMVFELSPQAGGVWTTRILHNFTFGGTDGLSPVAGVIMDPVGNLYGTTQGGGPHNFGTAFELFPTAAGVYTEKILHTFHGADGFLPSAPLVFDTSGHLYGTTFLGGANFGGEVFEIIR